MIRASSRFGRPAKTILVLLLLASAVAASATVYTLYYANSTGTVRAADVNLLAGPDSSGSCTTYPCDTVTVSGTSDTATVSLSLFKADPAFTPPPSSYYTNLVQVKNANAGAGHTVLSVSITSITDTRSTDFGSVTVYYCTVQCTFDSNGNVLTGTSIGSYTFTAATPGTVPGFGAGIAIAASGTHYIEIVAYAGNNAAVIAGDTITFKVAVQWV